MNRKQSQNWTTMLSNWLELFYLQAVLPEQNYIILLLTIENSATFRYMALYFKFHYVQQNSTTSGNIVYKPPLVAWCEAVWHEAALQ
jgi:hypothetical protein